MDQTSIKRLCASFSGGETSGRMVHWILSNIRQEYDEIVIIFANTGEEDEKTLFFVDACDRWFRELFGIGVVWVEAEVYPGLRKSPGAKVVTFETASRNGEPFEAAIQKYGIPNQKFNNCTRSLKLNPIRNYLENIGWPKRSYDTAVGIRADEIDRKASDAEYWRIIYPLFQRARITKPIVNAWWKSQSFRLGIKGYRGNCKFCWKKSFRKLFTILDEEPEAADFFERMEARYGFVGPEFGKPETAEGYRRTFFRGNKSVQDLRAERAALGSSFVPADDDADVYDMELDLGGSCGESCEVFADETLTQIDGEEA